MFHGVSSRRNCAGRQLLFIASFFLLLPTERVTSSTLHAVQAGPKTFASPQDAGTALADAATAKVRMKFGQSSAPEQRISSPRQCRRRQSLSEHIRQGLPDHKPLAEIERQQRIVAGWR